MPFDSAPVETDSVVLALMRAKQRIEDPANWCQGEASSKHRRCAIGAIELEFLDAADVLDSAAIELFNLDTADLKQCPVAWVNDILGHAAVMACYDRAIALRRAEEARRG